VDLSNVDGDFAEVHLKELFTLLGGTGKPLEIIDKNNLMIIITSC
jgi:hypothetical protein